MGWRARNKARKKDDRTRIETRNGSRLMIKSPRSGQWVTLCPLELESLTWQAPATFSAMIGHPFGPLVTEDE